MQMEGNIKQRRLPRFYRDPQHAVIGGVCAGIAESLDADYLLARVAAIVVAILTFGLAAVLYLLLWMILPVRVPKGGFVDVEPARVTSELYDRVVNIQANKAQPEKTAIHIFGIEAERSEERLGTRETIAAYRLSVVLFLLLSALITVAIVILETRVDEFAFVEFLPLYLFPLGVFQLTIPNSRRSIAVRISSLFICLELGFLLLLFSTGLCTLESFTLMSSVSFLLWFTVLLLLFAALMFNNMTCYLLTIVLFVVAMTSSFYDLGYFDPSALFMYIDAETVYSYRQR